MVMSSPEICYLHNLQSLAIKKCSPWLTSSFEVVVEEAASSPTGMRDRVGAGTRLLLAELLANSTEVASLSLAD